MGSLFQIKGFALFTEFFLKSTLVLAISLGLSYLLKKQSASLRHFLLSVSLIGLLFLPFVSIVLPRWSVGFFPSSAPFSTSYVITLSGDSHSGRMESSPTVVEPGVTDAGLESGHQATTSGTTFLGPHYRYGLAALWCSVACFMLVKVLFGLYGVSRLTRQGVSLRGSPWEELFRVFYMVFGRSPLQMPHRSFKWNVRLLKNERIVVPMTWGVLKPVVLLPAASSQWPVDQCSSVLFHELAHIKRRDFPVALLARIACCFYWFNPLSRIVLRRLRMEQEKACDEMVLKTGIRPSTYASSLLRMKTVLDNTRSRFLPAAALGMAGLSEFNERLTTILIKPLKQKEIRMKTKILFAILVFLLIALIGTANPYQMSAADKNKPVKPTKVPVVQAVPENPTAPTVPANEVVPVVAAAPETPAAPETEAVPAAPALPEAPVTAADEDEIKVKKEKKKKIKKKVKVRVKIKGDKDKDTVLIIASPDSNGKKVKEILLEGNETYYLETDESGNLWTIGTKNGKKIMLNSAKDKKSFIQVKGGKLIVTEKKGKGKDKHSIIIKTDRKNEREKDVHIDIDADKDVEVHEIDGTGMESFVDEEVEALGDDEEALLVIAEDAKDGKKGVQMVVSSDNSLADHLQRKLQILVSELRKDLPISYKVESKIGKITQKISIDYPMEKLDESTREKAQKRIGDFMREFKKVYSSLKDKKPLKKEIFIKHKTKEA